LPHLGKVLDFLLSLKVLENIWEVSRTSLGQNSKILSLIISTKNKIHERVNSNSCRNSLKHSGIARESGGASAPLLHSFKNAF